MSVIDINPIRKVDDVYYKLGEPIPNLGSVTCVNECNENGGRSYWALSKDFDKLPTGVNVITGSDCFFPDTAEVAFLMMDENGTKVWYRH